MRLVFSQALAKTYSSGEIEVNAIKGADFDIEIRLPLALNRGGDPTDYGEKQVNERIELRLRYFF